MGQRLFRPIAIFFFAFFIAGPGCDRKTGGATTAPSGPVTVASLVPAATDLLIGMGAADHLVAISNFDTPRDEIRNLPRIGDYQSIDWEKLAQIKPQVLIVFMAPDRMPAALRQNADRLKIRLINVKIERLDDVFVEIDKLGDLVQEREKAMTAGLKLRRQLDAVRARVRGQPTVPTLILRDETGQAAVGGDNFLDDVLTLAGGENVLKTSNRYPSIDGETLASLKPQAVLQLLPEAAPQLLDQAHQFWKSLPQLPAVKNNRVCIVTNWYAMQPGFHLGDLAERFADCLHPAANTAPSKANK